MERITEDILYVQSYINRTWPKLRTEVEIPLKELFDEPENNGLKHIWKFGVADLIIYNGNKPTCIVEVGGHHHMHDKKQQRNDRRKFMLCKTNEVGCGHFMNGVLQKLSGKQRRRQLGKLIFAR